MHMGKRLRLALQKLIQTAHMEKEGPDIYEPVAENEVLLLKAIAISEWF